jgi:hypothetical protein
LSGDYQLQSLEYQAEPTNQILVQVQNITANGAGLLTDPAGGITYQVDADRRLSVNAGPTHPMAYGIISSSGTVLLLMEAQYQDPGDTDDLQFHIGIHKSSGNTLAGMAGTYLVGQEGKDSGVFYTSRAELSLDSSGTGTWTTLTHSQGPIPPPYNVTVSLDPATSTFTMTSSAWTDTQTGILAPNAEVFAMVDDSANDTDTLVSLTIGVRKSAGTAPVMAGTYQTHFIGMDSGSKLAFRINAAFNQGTMMFDSTVLAYFDPLDPTGTGSAGTTFSTPVSAVVTDGTFTIDNAELGVLSPDGTFFMVLDADPSDGELKLVSGQR